MDTKIKTYLEFVENKSQFYSKNAMLNRYLHVSSQTIIVVLVALTPIFAAIESSHLMTQAEGQGLLYTLILSSILAVVEGIARIFRFKNLWLRFRVAANTLENAKRQFTNLNIDDQKHSDESFISFQNAIEIVIDDEQNGWQESIEKE
jgi:hypothetical protein